LILIITYIFFFIHKLENLKFLVCFKKSL